jgi:hypothetical protein
MDQWKQAFIKTHPGCQYGPSIEYEFENKTHIWTVDFEWNGKLYEVVNPSDFDEQTYAKWKKGDELHKQKRDIRWYLWSPMFEAEFPDYGPLENFRMTCSVGRHASPKFAWEDAELRFRAEENLAQQIGFGGQCLKKFLSGKYTPQELIIQRFTIAKIAPRVTSMSASQCKTLLKDYIPLLKEKGIYDPCGGFGGRKEFAKQIGIEYESYDVNPVLIKEVGHEYRDLITMPAIETGHVVFTSPPWEDKEVWPGSNGSNTEIHDKQWWYDLIREKVKAPYYIFINGAFENEQHKDKTGLFGSRNNMITTYGFS